MNYIGLPTNQFAQANPFFHLSAVLFVYVGVIRGLVQQVLYLHTYTCIHVYILKQEALQGPSEAVNTAHVRQYSPRSVASRAVLTDLGRIDGRGRPLKCFLVLLSD